MIFRKKSIPYEEREKSPWAECPKCKNTESPDDEFNCKNCGEFRG